MASQAAFGTDPGPLAAWMVPFAGCFTRPTWANLLVLAAGAILSPGRRTVAAALSSVGLRGAATFTNYHRVLNRSRWSGQAAARRLLRLLVAAFVPDGPIVVGIDETIERRWGARIKARGIYRDPVRSLQPRPLRQGIWPTLDQRNAARARAVCRAGLGLAVPDRAGPLRALRPGARAPAQAADRLGTPAPPAGRALAAGQRSLPSPTAATPPSSCSQPCAAM